MGKRIDRPELKLAKEIADCLKELDRVQMITIAEIQMYHKYVKILTEQHKHLKTLEEEFAKGKKSIAGTIRQIHWIEWKYSVSLTHESEHHNRVVEEINKWCKQKEG